MWWSTSHKTQSLLSFQRKHKFSSTGLSSIGITKPAITLFLNQWRDSSNYLPYGTTKYSSNNLRSSASHTSELLLGALKMRSKQISSENRTPDILPGTMCGEVLKKDVILRDLSCQGELFNGGVAAVILMMDNVFSFQSLSCKITHEPYSRKKKCTLSNLS